MRIIKNLSLGGERFGRSPPRKREMLCKRCACVCERVSVYVWGECGLYGGSVPFK